MPDPFEIIIGTYEQYLLGYKIENIVNEYKIERSFATHSHLASLRSVANNKHYLASAGADDSICLYDMRYRTECGKLMHHNDTVNCVAFTPDASHLFTCSNDGTIAAIRCGNWQIEKHWQKAHGGSPVNTLAIHPTGKLALSTGTDGVLRTWNLVKGRQAYATNLIPRLKLDAKNVVVIKWSPNGEKYLLVANQKIDIYSVQLAAIDNEIQFESKVVCVEFLRDDLIAVGLENGQIKFYDLQKSAATIDAVAHNIRVKCMAHHDDMLVTASSAGEIKLWRFTKSKLNMLQSVNCGARITCLSLAMPCKTIAVKKEIKVEDEISVKRKHKFRIRQEVIIEDEDGCDGWEVTNIKKCIPKVTQSESNTELKRKKKSLGKERSEDTHISKKKKEKFIDNVNLSKKKGHEIVENENTEESPKKKQKLLAMDSINNNSSTKKRKELSQERTSSVVRKKKKNTKLTPKSDIITMKKTKTKSTPFKETQDILQNKKRKKGNVDETDMFMKKKKKKHFGVNKLLQT